MPSPSRSIVLHGHFYQPPREDPWTGVVPEQPSAAPFHDWNERITHECYEAVTTARILSEGSESGEEGNGAHDVAERLNTLEWMSFNFGPTLLDWLEPNAPDVYAAILDADRRSVERLDGHGNALAMPYHHPILPLSAPRDRATEIRWGIDDFRRRFGREPEGMWLPETAVDTATLSALARAGIRFTVLAPHQVDPVPEDGRPGLFVTPEGDEIALFVYDGALSHGVAFGNLLRDGVAWAETMKEDGKGPALRSLATDGETFGHHHKFSEMALARAIAELRDDADIRLENFASWLAREGAHDPVTLVEPTAWSCAHGVDRWRDDCGCAADPGSEYHQAWRGPLREALEWLADGLHEVFAREGAALFDDPWAAREAWVRVPEGHGLRPGLTPAQTARAAELLDMERDALRLFTSCAWFFDDVGGLEPRQVIGYAVRAVELSRSERLRTGVLDRFGQVVSNDPNVETAAAIFEDIERHRAVIAP